MYVTALAYLHRHCSDKSFEAITNTDLFDYINGFQKTREEDPDQSWIATQRTLGLPLLKFFKWMSYPKLTPQERSKLPKNKYPAVLEGFVLQTKKGTKTPIKQKDIWDDKDTAIFLKSRLRFYHALAYQSSARPSELLQLKIGDIEIQVDKNGKLCALIDVGRYGKRKQSRIVGITDFAIQYYQSYISNYHPDSTNKKAYIFVNTEYSAQSRNIQLSSDALRQDYKAFRDRKIPKLLKRPDIPEPDKKHLRYMKDTKKWFPYIVRHSSLSKLAPNVSEYRLREYAGWSKRSDMVEIYTHTLTGDSAEDILMLYGVNLNGGRKRRNEQLQQEMVGPHCPFCHAANIPDSQFCSSCHKPVTVISYQKVMEEAEQTRQEFKAMKEEHQRTIKEMQQTIEETKQITCKMMTNSWLFKDRGGGPK